MYRRIGGPQPHSADGRHEESRLAGTMSGSAAIMDDRALRRRDWRQRGVMSDGTVAVVHGQNYHIDWVGADGKIRPSAKVAHEWKRLSDDDKVRMADSMTVFRDSANKAM